MILGTGICADFPTLNGNIYPRALLEQVVNDRALRDRISSGAMVGGVLDPRTLEPVAGIVTHKVTDIRLLRDELVIDVEFLDTPDANLVLAGIRNREAAVIIGTPEQLKDGATVKCINVVKAIHIRERRTGESC